MTSLVSATKESLEIRKGGKQSTLDCWKKTKATNEEISWGWIGNNKINIATKDQQDMETSRNSSVRICSKEEVYDTSSSSDTSSRKQKAVMNTDGLLEDVSYTSFFIKGLVENVLKLLPKCSTSR